MRQIACGTKNNQGARLRDRAARKRLTERVGLRVTGMRQFSGGQFVVKWVLRRLLSGSRPDLRMIGKELGISERTLQRRITEEGTTFRQLLNEIRHELVRQYLDNASVEITEAAFLIGYEDPNSFYRAFGSWEGKTPAEWRAANERRKSKRS